MHLQLGLVELKQPPPWPACSPQASPYQSLYYIVKIKCFSLLAYLQPCLIEHTMPPPEPACASQA
eukprot:1158029-Pelagomonas_calceolata.AAC.2